MKASGRRSEAWSSTSMTRIGDVIVTPCNFSACAELPETAYGSTGRIGSGWGYCAAIPETTESIAESMSSQAGFSIVRGCRTGPHNCDVPLIRVIEDAGARALVDHVTGSVRNHQGAGSRRKPIAEVIEFDPLDIQCRPDLPEQAGQR